MSVSNTDASQKVLQYIERLPEWSKQLCLELQRIILTADPLIKEKWKWGPHYSANGMVCGFGAFQKHVKLTFFNGCALKDSHGLFNHCTDNEFSRSIKYVPESKVDEALLTVYVKEAVTLNKGGFKRVLAPKNIEIPADLHLALKATNTALLNFENLTPGYQQEFIRHVTGAKQEKTRHERILKVTALIAAGKTLNDKYKEVK